MEPTQENDIVYVRLRLISQLIISLVILSGTGLLLLSPEVSNKDLEASGATAVITLVVTYWFGRIGVK